MNFVYDGTQFRFIGWGYESGNTNTYIRVYRQTSGYDGEYPLLIGRTKATSIGDVGSNSTYDPTYGVFREASSGDATLTANPAKGSITATTFNGSLNGNAASATKATNDGDGNEIKSTYALKGHTHSEYAPVSHKHEINDVTFPVGSIYTTPTNVSPASYLGGTWQLVDKHLKYAAYNSSDVSGLFAPTANVGNNTVIVTTHNHTVNVYVSVNTAVALDDTNRSFGVIDFTKCGFSRLDHAGYTYGSSDAAEGIAFVELGNTSGRVQSYAVTPKIDGGAIPSGAMLRIQFALPVSSEHMNDAYCDKFFWKRTA
jgi:hypothetical protein